MLPMQSKGGNAAFDATPMQSRQGSPLKEGPLSGKTILLTLTVTAPHSDVFVPANRFRLLSIAVCTSSSASIHNPCAAYVI